MVGNSKGILQLKYILTGVFFVCFIILHVYLKRSVKPSFESLGPKIGESAALFEGQTLDKKNIRLAEIVKTHKITILNFWESWCGPCKIEMPDLQKIYEGNKDRGLQMIGICQSSSESSIDSIIREHSLSFPMMIDSDGKLASSYGVKAVPTTFVISSDLKILRSHVGIDVGLQSFVEEQFRKMERKNQ